MSLILFLIPALGAFFTYHGMKGNYHVLYKYGFMFFSINLIARMISYIPVLIRFVYSPQYYIGPTTWHLYLGIIAFYLNAVSFIILVFGFYIALKKDRR